MTATQSIPIRNFTREQMLKRVARFNELKFPADRYPDSQLPGNERKNFLVIGTGLVIEGGKDPMSAIPIREGFLMSYVEAKPGNGPRLHTHDTNETFVAIRGVWRVIWGMDEKESIDLNPLDVISMPAGAPRRFVCMTPGENSESGLLLTMQAGDDPRAEWMHRDQWLSTNAVSK